MSISCRSPENSKDKYISDSFIDRFFADLSSISAAVKETTLMYERDSGLIGGSPSVRFSPLFADC